MTLPDDIETALTAYAAEQGIDHDEAVARILRQWLINEGHLSSGEEGTRPEWLNASNDD
jgi:hypothetical protein